MMSKKVFLIMCFMMCVFLSGCKDFLKDIENELQRDEEYYTEETTADQDPAPVPENTTINLMIIGVVLLVICIHFKAKV